MDSFVLEAVTSKSVVAGAYHCHNGLYHLDQPVPVLAHSALSVLCCQCCDPAASHSPYDAEPLPRPFPLQSGRFLSTLAVVQGNALYSTFSWINSNFFASSSSLGTPCAFVCALRQSSHNSLQNLAVSLSRKPVSWICRTLTLGCFNGKQSIAC